MDTTNIRQLISGLQRDDPKLWEALNFLVDNVDKINDELFPTIAAIQRELEDILPGDPENFQAAFLLQSIGFSWSFVPNALQYEMRVGPDWDNADFVLRTTSLTAIIPPKVLGTYIFRLRTVSPSGNYSLNEQVLTAVVDGPSAVFVTVEVVDNNVLLTWAPAVSEFQISHYIVKRNGIQVGTITGTFTVRFETIAGTFVYGVTPVDIAGNAGPENSVTAVVSQPPDFVFRLLCLPIIGMEIRLIAMPMIRSIFSGRNKTPPNPTLMVAPVLFPEPSPYAVAGSKLLTIVDQNITWQNHFTSKGWNTIQDQLNAGYNFYAQPCPLTGSYTEIFDFGVLITNSIIAVNLSRADVFGDVDVSVWMAYSVDGVSYSVQTQGASLFSPSFRYVYVRLDFSENPGGAAGGVDLTVFTKLSVNISVKEVVDSGSFLANAGHASPGTSHAFNKPFKDINSLTATVESTNEPYEVVLSWVDAPNPTTFSVMVFDTAGNRVTKQISWKARGVV